MMKRKRNGLVMATLAKRERQGFVLLLVLLGAYALWTAESDRRSGAKRIHAVGGGMTFYLEGILLTPQAPISGFLAGEHASRVNEVVLVTSSGDIELHWYAQREGRRTQWVSDPQPKLINEGLYQAVVRVQLDDGTIVTLNPPVEFGIRWMNEGHHPITGPFRWLRDKLN